jgi:ribonuclease M5
MMAKAIQTIRQKTPGKRVTDLMENIEKTGKIRISRAIIVEGRDDVDAVSKAADALIIPTHGFGIRETTWEIMEKAYREIGVIILTDPDHAGEDIRRRLTERFPEAVQCYMARRDTEKAGDIGIENASPEDIRDALERALSLHDASEETSDDSMGYREVTMSDLAELGLSGSSGSSQLRTAVSGELGIGYCNAKMMVKRLRAFRIGYEELAETVSKVTAEQTV